MRQGSRKPEVLSVSELKVVRKEGLQMIKVKNPACQGGVLYFY
jgi:hypothetical protein